MLLSRKDLFKENEKLLNVLMKVVVDGAIGKEPITRALNFVFEV
jgi:hypothetical protein